MVRPIIMNETKTETEPLLSLKNKTIPFMNFFRFNLNLPCKLKMTPYCSLKLIEILEFKATQFETCKPTPCVLVLCY